MNFEAGFAAALPMIGRKTDGSTVSVSAGHAASPARSAERLVWRRRSASRASDRAGWTLEVHNRL
jgi:hypothetical protein